MTLRPREPTEADREALRAWLDRAAPSPSDRLRRSWRIWFDGAVFLGVSSARTGPDKVGANQSCRCEQCCATVPP